MVRSNCAERAEDDGPRLSRSLPGAELRESRPREPILLDKAAFSACFLGPGRSGMGEQAVKDRAFAASLRVPFRDVDMHGHVHNATYLSYCEAAIVEFLRANSLGGYFSPKGDSIVYLVRKTELLFNKPSVFEDVLHFEVMIARLGSASIGFTVNVHGEDEETPRVIASIVWVCVDVGQRRSVGIPKETMSALAPLAAGARASGDEGR